MAPLRRNSYRRNRWIAGKLNINQSAAKPLLEEGSETISQESTLVTTNGSAGPLTSNVEGDDIVQGNIIFLSILNAI
jgi:hypothetical protein